jgi:hypothetical protein
MARRQSPHNAIATALRPWRCFAVSAILSREGDDASKQGEGSARRGGMPAGGVGPGGGR